MNLAICFNRLEIINTFLNTFNMFKKEDKFEGFHFWLCPDPRANLSLDNLNIPSECDHSILTFDLEREFIQPQQLTELSKQYVWKHTHHVKLICLYLLAQKGISELFFLDDDTVVLHGLDTIFCSGSNGGFYAFSPLFYYDKRSPLHMRELDEFSWIVNADLRKCGPENDTHHKICQYNAGHFQICLEPHFLESVERYYQSTYLAKRYFENVYDLQNDRKYPGVKFFNRSFFDEQRFLTHYFISNPNSFQHKALNRQSEVYHSKKHEEFVDQTASKFLKKMSHYKILHYGGEEKSQRAKKFRELNPEIQELINA